jgi:hypothetical protein
MTYNIPYKDIIKLFIALLAILLILSISRPISTSYIEFTQPVDSTYETYYPIEAIKIK